MENFKIGLFEILGSILPGIPVAVLIMLIMNFNGLDLIYLNNLISETNTWSAISFIVVSYCIGFAMTYPSYEWFKFLAKRIWPKRIGKKPTSIGKRGKELSKIRHSSPSNYSILNTFMAHRTMSYNLSFSLSLFTISSIVLYCINSSTCTDIVFSTIVFSCVGLAVLLMRRAVSFHEWIQRIITETNKILED